MPNVKAALTNSANLAVALQEQFYRFIDDFNQINDPAKQNDLRDFVLDQHVLVVGVDDPKKHTISGINPVIQFFINSKGHYDPIFTSFSVIGDNGYAIGAGNWTDVDDTNAPILISFIFINNPPQDSSQNPWRAIRLWGSRPEGDLKQHPST